PRTACYGRPLLDAVRDGLVGIATVDRAVRRVLRAKFELGLFEEPFPSKEVMRGVADSANARRLAREAAEQSVVLLTNRNGILPLDVRRIRCLAVVGPNADSSRNLYGDYAYTTHIMEDNPLRTVTVLAALRRSLAGHARVIHAKGCEVSGTDTSGIASAVEAARRADVVVAVLGERAGIRDGDLSGEGRDRPSLKLPGLQQELLDAVCDTGKPVVLVLVNGRPLAIASAVERCAAVMEAWYPGEEGGTAVARVLFGEAVPSGRLPVSFPRDAGEVPVHYGRHPSAFSGYVDANSFPAGKKEPKPLFAFGHGLSYTLFRYSRLRIRPARFSEGDSVVVSCCVKNAGKRSGTEVVQLYVRDDVASIERPVKELKGWYRLTLNPGEMKEVVFRLWLEQLAFLNRDMRLTLEPGVFTVMVGSSSEDIRLKGVFEFSGPPRVFNSRSHYFSEVGCRDAARL
ncbi:MAG: glycoside hydrolase family 3 C-terminal domain-containing protein, partial [Kiritimatiellae bacterium]|nr:glycoside hydrolase family 3 C-terminal domain-containing protein [Kiritimatiellia bacterium]